MISTENLSLKIGHKTLLDFLSIQMEYNQLHLVIGPNGAGKSTLIKLLSGIQKSSTGEVLYNQKSIKNFEVNTLAKKRAVLSQRIDFPFPLKVKEVVIMGRYPHFTTQPKAIDKEVVKEAMHLFEILNLAERDYTTLSGGEQQRVHFARVMAQIWPADNTSKILFLDEPLTYLDVKYQYDFLNKISSYIRAQKLTVVGVLHDLNLAAHFADCIWMLHRGKLIARGKPKEVLSVKNIEKVYDMTPQIIERNGNLGVFF